MNNYKPKPCECGCGESFIGPPKKKHINRRHKDRKRDKKRREALRRLKVSIERTEEMVAATKEAMEWD